MYKIQYILILIILGFIQCKQAQTKVESIRQEDKQTDSIQIQFSSDFIATAFDYPVGKPNAKGYYNAQKFKENNHLGDDWNANTGGNTDLGDSIYAIADGYVVHAFNHKGGWGKVIRIVHKMPNNRYVESLYAHCDSILVTEKTFVKRGDKIGTIGTADGRYLAHLHFELRNQIGMPLGGGYSENTQGYMDPTQFIKENRTIK